MTRIWDFIEREFDGFGFSALLVVMTMLLMIFVTSIVQILHGGCK